MKCMSCGIRRPQSMAPCQCKAQPILTPRMAAEEASHCYNCDGPKCNGRPKHKHHAILAGHSLKDESVQVWVCTKCQQAIELRIL